MMISMIIPAPAPLTSGIPNIIPPRPAVYGIRVTDIMQNFPGHGQALAHTISQRIPPVFEIHPDKPPLEPSAVRHVFGVGRLGDGASKFNVVVVVDVKVGL